MNIRPVARADLPALRAVIDAVDLFPSAMLDDMVEDFLAGNASDANWLTVDDDGPVAVAYYVSEPMTEGTWNLLLIAVDPARQGGGVGTALMAHVEAVLADAGGRILLVETSGSADFEQTRAFYRRRGYDEEARIREFYQASEDKIVFRKALSPPG